MVANGMGLTLLPEISVKPKRSAVASRSGVSPILTVRRLGLAWRRRVTSGDFTALGAFILTAIRSCQRPLEPDLRASRKLRVDEVEMIRATLCYCVPGRERVLGEVGL